MTTYHYSIKTLTPVHIGTGERMTPLEYHLDGQLIVPDMSRLFSRHPEEAEGFSQKLAATSPAALATKPLGQLLSVSALGDPGGWRYWMPALYEKETLTRLSREMTKGNGEILIGTKTVDYKAYIPGSSLKGALKTAWAYAQCLEDSRALDEIAGLLRKDELNAERAAREGEKALSRHIFHSPAQRDDYEHRINRAADAAYDVFRAVQVGDTASASADETMILAGERILSAGVPARGKQPQSGGAGIRAQFKGAWTFSEAIDSEMAFPGRLQIDDHVLSDRAQRAFGWNKSQRAISVGTLREACNRFALDLCDWEIEYFSRIPPSNGCETGAVLDFYRGLKDQVSSPPDDTIFLCLGHGSGWHKMTIGLLLEKRLNKDEFARLRNVLRLDDRHAEFEYPKSRKLIMVGENEAESPFGWTKCTFIRQPQGPNRSPLK
jgi:CRISPR-associated protein Csm5